MSEKLKDQIDRLANYIIANVPGEPSQSEGAIGRATRIINTLRNQLDEERDGIDKQRQVIMDLSDQLAKKWEDNNVLSAALEEIKHETSASTDELGMWIYKTSSDTLAEIKQE